MASQKGSQLSLSTWWTVDWKLVVCFARQRASRLQASRLPALRPLASQLPLPQLASQLPALMLLGSIQERAEQFGGKRACAA